MWADAADQQAWMAGGSYLVARKIAMLIESWDRVRLAEQERIKRSKGEGAPLSGGIESLAEPDFAAKDAMGATTIAPVSQAGLHPEFNAGGADSSPWV